MKTLDLTKTEDKELRELLSFEEGFSPTRFFLRLRAQYIVGIAHRGGFQKIKVEKGLLGVHLAIQAFQKRITVEIV